MARSFTAASSQSLSNGSAVATAAPITFACWFKQSTTTGVHALMSLGVNGGSQRIVLFSNGSGTGNPSISTVGASGNQTAISSNAFSANTWTHACGVVASNTSASIYCNGGGKVTDAVNNSGGWVGLNRTYIGARMSTTLGVFMNGEIAEAGAWNVALSDDEVAALADRVSPLLIRPASLIAYWPLMGRTSPEIDVKGLYPMTLSGTPTQADHPPMSYPGQVHVIKVAAASTTKPWHYYQQMHARRAA